MSRVVRGHSRAQISSSAPAREPRSVYCFDPLADARWNQLLSHHADASVFHSSAWLESLRRTYGYEPIGFTTCPPESELRNAAVFCRVDSRLTGRRLVSLPFADHCDILVDGESDMSGLRLALAEQMKTRKLRYIELRPIGPLPAVTQDTVGDSTYCLHRLDLRPSVASLYRNLHKDSTQRKIRRAEREGLHYQAGRSGFLLEAFNHLWFRTRRRHLIPPQPAHWFRNLVECFGEALEIRVAVKDRQAVAAILTLQHKDTLVYKYGCSDERWHRLGGMQMLLWRSILEAKRDGLRVFDLGRSEWKNQGLITFKDRWGAERSTLTYFVQSRSSCPNWKAMPTVTGWKERFIKRASPYLPDSVFRKVGAVMYRHIG